LLSSRPRPPPARASGRLTSTTSTDQDWELFLGYLNQTLDEFSVPEAERSDLLSYLNTTRPELVNV
jgi:hypothetical protein